MDFSGNATLRSGENEYANREIGDPRVKTANREIGDPRGNPGGKSGGGIKSPVWHREYWDRFIRDSRHYEQAVEYIHQNPVKTGLAATAAEWPWSSASFSGMDFSGNAATPGNATLRSGKSEYANQEIGDPGVKSGDPGVAAAFKGEGQVVPSLGLTFTTAGGIQKLQCWNTSGILMQ